VVPLSHRHRVSKSHHTVVLANGSTCKASSLSDLRLKIGDYQEEMDFLVAPIAHDVILGKPWLESVNPTIDWNSNILLFTDPHGYSHLWDADTLEEDDSMFISAMQLKKLAKRSDTKIWMCTITESKDLMTKHLKDELSFKELVNQTAADKPAYLKKTL